MALFSGKIVCPECRKYYKRKLERGRSKYVCQGYDNKLTNCTRVVIDEESLREFIGRRLFIQDRKQENIENLIQDRVTKIEILNKEEFAIYFNNEEPMLKKKQHIHY